MKTIKTKLLKLYNASIVGVLAILGFMACVNAGCAKYGVPCAEAKHLVKGNVSSQKTQQPIKGVNVIAECNHSQTNESGDYQIKTPPRVHLHFRDPAGNYKNLDTLIEFQGETSKTVNIQLTPKENNE